MRPLRRFGKSVAVVIPVVEPAGLTVTGLQNYIIIRIRQTGCP